MTDAGVNTTVTTFEWNGDQRVVVHAGGGVFAGATRGDGIWMFSRNGTMKSLPVAAAPGGGGGGFGPRCRRRAACDVARPPDLRRACGLVPEEAATATATTNSWRACRRVDRAVAGAGQRGAAFDAYAGPTKDVAPRHRRPRQVDAAN
jgi:hypothetical protein